jgi:hypothetical protein
MSRPTPSLAVRSAAVGALVLGLALCGARPGDAQTLGRREFTRRMARIHRGTPKAEVLRLLGKPSDVRTRADPEVRSHSYVQEVWCYGASGHRAFPTLGVVSIDSNKVQWSSGGRGQPPDPALLSETQLRTLLPLLDRAPRFQGSRYNPLPLIQIVNTLQPLGKDKALAAISEYLRVLSGIFGDGDEGIYLVLRLLFDVPKDPGYMPEMAVGSPGPYYPADLKKVPRFPLAVQDDVPLLQISGYMQAGLAASPEGEVEYFRRHGTLRSAPLHPTDHPLDIIDALEQSDEWLFGDKPVRWGDRIVLPKPRERLSGRHMIMEQLLRLIATVYRLPDTDGWDTRLPYGSDAEVRARWDQIRAEVAKRPIRWDAVRNCYTFSDGTRLPVERHAPYRAFFWKPALAGVGPVLTVRRLGPNWVNLYLEWHYSSKAKVAPAVIEVHTAKDRGKPLARFPSPGPENFAGGSMHARLGTSGTIITTTTVRVPAGEPLLLEMTGAAGKKVRRTLVP